MDALDELHSSLRVIRDRVRGVALGYQTGFYLFGRPGTSKTYTVLDTLDQIGADYYHHQGSLSPVGLFDLLAEHPDRISVLDDVGTTFEEPRAQEILLPALAARPDGQRVISRRTHSTRVRVYYTGGVIGISNLQFSSTPRLGAVRSRLQYVAYEPSEEQIVALMRQLASQGQDDLTPDECSTVAEFVRAQTHQRELPLDLRNYTKALQDYRQHWAGHAETDWRDLVISALNERVAELAYTPPQTRAERIAAEKALVERILSEHADPADQFQAYREVTGKSKAAFYRRRAR